MDVLIQIEPSIILYVLVTNKETNIDAKDKR